MEPLDLAAWGIKIRTDQNTIVLRNQVWKYILRSPFSHLFTGDDELDEEKDLIIQEIQKLA